MPYTFFGDKNCPNVIQQVLQAQNRDQLIYYKGNANSLRYLFEENSNSLIKINGDLSDNAASGHSWLVEVCRHVRECMEKARKDYVDKFSLSDVLASFIQLPYGMFTSMLNCAALSYALREYKAELFQPSISQPVSDEALAGMITELFKMWKEGKSDHSNKLLRFGSREESDLTKLLYDTFDLGKILKVKQAEVKSLDNAKWYIQEFCKQYAKHPLWVLTYVTGLSDDLKKTLKSLIAIFDQDALTVDKIKLIYKDIKNNHVELNILLTDSANYEKGFTAFVESIGSIKIEKGWWNDMLVQIAQLPSEIAFRKEADVKEAIYRFYISKNTGNTGGNSGSGNNVKSGSNSGSNISTSTPDGNGEDVIKAAKDKIKSTNMPNTLWQRAILDLLEQYPETAEFFNRL